MDTTTSTAPSVDELAPAPAPPADDAASELVEDVSIDGMCGVY